MTDSMSETGSADQHVPLLTAAAHVWGSYKSQINAGLELFSTEIRYSGVMFATAIFMAVVSGLALFSAWGLFLAAISTWLGSLGFSLPLILVIFMVANLALVAVALTILKRSIQNIGLNHTSDAIGLKKHES